MSIIEFKKKPTVYDPLLIQSRVFDDLDEHYALDREWADHQADIRGLVVVPSTADTLQLDFDSEAAYEEFLESRLPKLLNLYDVKRVYWTESASGNKHVYVVLPFESTPIERIALQAVLGSDPIRELLSIRREDEGADNPSLFFEKPNAVEHVIYATDGYQPQLEAGVQPLALLQEVDIEEL